MKYIDRVNTHSVKFEKRLEKFGKEDILPLWVADIDLQTSQAIQEQLIHRAKHPAYGYTVYPVSYYNAIIHWMQQQFHWDIEKEWIVPAHGVVTSINLAISAYTKEGDGVIVQTPIYPPFSSSVKHHKRELLENRLLLLEGNYTIDFEDFEAKAKKAKLFLLCSPHNPTGRAWNQQELEKMAAICQKHDVIIIADEIHSDIVFDKTHIPMAKLTPQRTVTLNAPSKSFNIAGLNTSYAIISDKNLRRLYGQEQRGVGFNNGNLFGIEALIAAYTQSNDWLKEFKAYLKANIEYIHAFVLEHNIQITPIATEATYLIWLDCHKLGLSDEGLEDFFINKAKLGLNSGRSFGLAGSGFMRLNIATSKQKLQEAMQLLLKAYNKRERNE